jgi:phage FluMu gp28-like protein
VSDPPAEDVGAEPLLEGPFPPHAGDVLPDAMKTLPRGRLLLTYQQAFHQARSEPGLLFVEKSRRIGLTWGVASTATLRAARSRQAGGRNQLYIGYALDMTKEFIDAAAMWAKAFGMAASSPEEFLFEDQDEHGDTRHIKAFSISFASGFRIQALSSAPRSLRGKQGDVIIDEAAFVTDLAALLDAAMALAIWGGDVTVISTHYGVDNVFNQEIQKIRAGDRLGRVMTITFADALAQGLYERICLVKREPATAEGKIAFEARIRGMYGTGAAQELDCVPSRSGGAWLAFDQIERAEDASAPVLRLAFDDAFAFKLDHIRQAMVVEWCEQVLAPRIAELDLHAGYGVGIDFARSSDLSVVWLLQELPDRAWRTPFTIEMRNTPFLEQETVVKHLLRRLRRWRSMADANGNGQYLAERLAQLFGPTRAEAVRTNEGWWRDNGPPVKSRFEDGRIAIPRDADTAADLRMVRVVNGVPAVPQARTTAKGEDASASAGGKAKRHADAAVALVMAGAAIRQGIMGALEFRSAGRTGVAGPASGYGAGSEPLLNDRGFGAAASEIQLAGF